MRPQQDLFLSATPRYYAAAKTSFPAEFKNACGDVVRSLSDLRIWFTLGLNDVIGRYRGSILGPFWITLTMAIFALGIGFLYAGLMKVSLDRYLPWMTTSMVIWTMISQTVLDSSEAFIAASETMRQTSLPAPIFVWRVVWRNLLIFVHQAPVLIVLGWKFGYLLRINLPEAVFGLALVVLNLSWFAVVSAVICARFRDLKQILASLIQLIFFLSPVLWIPNEMKGLGGKLMAVNPVAQMLEVVRAPLIAESPSLYSVIYLLAAAAAGWLFTLTFLARTRRRIVHYV
jgi:ABC-type polysaccharide/polyol phosphate export permease